jgi:hypothetical protein
LFPLQGDNIKFEDIKKSVKGVKFVTLRFDSDELFEVVLAKGDLGQLTGCLVNIFGEPVFPSEKKYSFDPQKMVDDYGGVMPGQTLYYLEQSLIFAMLWPWQDGVNITFKLIKKPQ